MNRNEDNEVMLDDEPIPVMVAKAKSKRKPVEVVKEDVVDLEDEYIPAPPKASIADLPNTTFEGVEIWGVAVLSESQIVRDNPVSVSVNGRKVYFPYEIPVLVQAKYVEALKHSYHEGHRIMKDAKGRNRNVFKPIHHVLSFKPLSAKNQNTHGLSKFAAENPDIILAENAAGYR